ncbi:MAG: class F sortase [Streptosporangiales bacterium]|nr:class F sortase [Streptosporangiales bacterium]
MRGDGTGPHTPRGGGRRVAHVAASLVVVAGLVVLGVTGYQLLWPAQPRVTSAGELSGAGETSWRGRTDTESLPRSRPTAVRVPAIDVDADLVGLSMGKDGVLDAPDTGSEAGWYDALATPGQRGTSVIAGHVDWSDGPAVFYDLGELAPGDAIEVARADGRTAVFTVHATRQYSKNDFPSDLVYGPSRAAELRLITCGGAFANGHYVDNIVVFAHLSAIR